MVLRITKREPVPCEPTLVTSGGPKRREKASWSSSVTSWPRNTRTECSSKAARAAAYAASSEATSASVTPRSSAANPGPSGTMSIGKSSLILWCSFTAKQPGRQRSAADAFEPRGAEPPRALFHVHRTAEWLKIERGYGQSGLGARLMRRREFLRLVGGVAIGWPFAAPSRF